MAMFDQAEPLDLTRQIWAFIRRHTDKSFDWDAFPGSRGFPELERAQMRYIGAGGSPKADDPSTLKPGQFTLSLVYRSANTPPAIPTRWSSTSWCCRAS